MVAGNLKQGRSGESIAQAFLRNKGYSILSTNWRSKRGELDIVCCRGSLLVFVEVKTRGKTSQELPAEALTLQKQKRILRAANAYLTQYRYWDRPCRFDLVSVYLEEQGCKVEHVPHVIELSNALGGGHTHWQPW